MTTFSIITCTWNSEPYVRECIESVQGQDHPQVQQVFVDGGSEDGTLERIKGLGGHTVWRTDVRGGISNAMNVGVSMADGEVIAHLHGDDFYLNPGVLKQVAGVFERQRVDWLFGRIVSCVDGQLQPMGWNMPAFSRPRLLRGNFIGHPAVFIKRSLFEQAGGFDVGLRYAMDYDLWLRLSKVAAPAFLDAPLSAFRRHAGSTSTANAQAAFEEDHQVRLRHLGGALPLQRLVHGLRYRVRRWRRGLPLRG